MITNLKEKLDCRICDCESDTTNTQTYREFIRESEEEFEIEPLDIDSMNEDELIEHLEFMDYLWSK